MPVARKRRQYIKGRPHSQIDEVGQASAGTITTCHLSVLDVHLDGHETAISWQGACEPNRAVTAQSAQFQNVAGPNCLRYDKQELALAG